MFDAEKVGHGAGNAIWRERGKPQNVAGTDTRESAERAVQQSRPAFGLCTIASLS